MLSDYLGRSNWLTVARRWEKLRQEHARTISMVRRGESPDTVQRQVAVARRAMDLAPKVAQESANAKTVGLAQWLGTRGKEAVIGRSDFESGAFLEIGLAVGRAVCLVQLADAVGRTLLRGTGFLVAPNVVATNNHVLMSPEEAQRATITFDYRNDPYGRPMQTTVFTLRPDLLFETDKTYDCTFVGVGSRESGALNASDFGWLPLAGAEGKVEVGDPINIIQHPSGEPMQWVIRDNRLLSLPQLEDERDPAVFAHYEADTKPGSSGAPALSRLWEVFALHHQAVPAIDASGNILDKNGVPYAGDDDTRVQWIGNEGIRVSALVRFLTARREVAQGEAAQALDSVLMAKRPDYVALAVASRGRNVMVAGADTLEGYAMTGRIEFTLPLKVSISLGTLVADDTRVSVETKVPPDAVDTSSTPKKSGADSVPALSQALHKERDEALQTLERSRTRIYFDSAQADTDKQAYYQAIALSQDPSANFNALHTHLERTHATKPRYAPARQLYPWVDLCKQGRRLAIKSIYSGKLFDAQEFIEADFAIEGRREALRESLRKHDGLSRTSEAVIDQLLEDSAPYNCEHVVPQSWFSKKEPMRGDLHHLFACESKCNSFRGNHAYFDFPDTEATMDECGRREEDQFEPISGKGAVARATFYFLVRYPKSIDLGISEMSPERLGILKRWHTGDPVSEYERHRNQAIFEVQGNRNPFVDHPEWVGQVQLESSL